MHIFVRDFDINRSEPALRGTLRCRYDNGVNLVSVRYSDAI